jgi:hypothetical protein
MSCCPVRAGCALLIRLEHVLIELVVRCLSIAQCTPILDWESRSVPLVRPLAEPDMPMTSLRGQTLHRLDDGVRSDHAEIRVEVVFHSTKRSHIERRQFADHRVFARGVGRFTVVVPNHVDSSSFLARISLGANPEDWVVIDRVPIGGCAKMSIESVVVGY